MSRVISLFAGLLFGMGMAISGMVDPQNVTAFLDVTGEWSADLAFVMGGALSVFLPSYYLLIKKRQKPVLTTDFCLPTNKNIDLKLLSGATFFGIGWGLVGFCPGPVVSSLAVGSPTVWIFFAFMMVGLGATNFALNSKSNTTIGRTLSENS